MEWDKIDNLVTDIGYLTLYSKEYDGELSDYIHEFNAKEIEFELDEAKDYIEDMRLSHGEDINSECDLVGINSNSFKSNRDKHNLFLEWDTEHYVPEEHVLNQFDGMLIQTDGGYHLIKEADLTTEELISQMKRWNCCPGFTGYSFKRRHACLRICPKGENRLRITKDKDGFLYSIYKEFVSGLNKY